MKTICTGWVVGTARVRTHDYVIVMKDDGRDDDHISHGMCPNCSHALEAALDFEIEYARRVQREGRHQTTLRRRTS